MTLTELDELIELELTMALAPLCEDDHKWYDEVGRPVAPTCTHEAEAVLIQVCAPVGRERPRELICRPLAEWIDKQNGECARHAESSHLKVVWV
jgi:hypothetical protein